MDINNMTEKQFKALPCLTDAMGEIEVDSIVLLPKKIKDGSGYNLYSVVVCNNRKPIGKTTLYDTFSIYTSMDGYNRVGIDCLRSSGLMRLFLEPNKYVVDHWLRQIKEKKRK